MTRPERLRVRRGRGSRATNSTVRAERWDAVADRAAALDLTDLATLARLVSATFYARAAVIADALDAGDRLPDDHPSVLEKRAAHDTLHAFSGARWSLRNAEAAVGITR